MTATLDGVAARKKGKPELTAEQLAAEELVRRAREQGLSLIGPDGPPRRVTAPGCHGRAVRASSLPTLSAFKSVPVWRAAARRSSVSARFLFGDLADALTESRIPG